MLSEVEVQRLGGLLSELISSGQTFPNVPDALWKPANALTPRSAIEVALIDRSTKKLRLVPRKDNNWDGIHLPGGYILNKESMRGALDRLANDELGITIKNPQLIFTHKWLEGQHPYGHPISNIVVCESDQSPRAGLWFEGVPQKMVQNHAFYAHVVFAYINGKVSLGDLANISMAESPHRDFVKRLRVASTI